VGPYIYETYGYDITFVIGRDDRTAYVSVEGEPAAANAFQLPPGLDRLVRMARAIPRAELGAVSGYLEIDGRVALVGASPILPEPTNPIDVPPGPPPVLVYGKLLESDLLDPIAAGLGLRELRFVPPQAAVDIMLRLTALDGASLGGVGWQPPRLGREFIRDIAPSLVLALGLIVGFAWLVLHHARRATRALAASEARFRDIAEASADWIWETDVEGCLVFLSERFAQITSLAPHEFLRRSLGNLFAGDAGTEDTVSLRTALEARRPFRDVLGGIEDGSGSKRILRFAGKPAVDHAGRFLGYRGTASDVTAQTAAEQRVRYFALHDAMTQLPNRELLRRRLDQALAGVRRRDTMVAVLVVDLDRFKSVNDTLGHGAGDRLIALCSKRLEACVRQEDTVARIGGDEFALVQVAVEGPGPARALCDRLLTEFIRPFDLDGQEIIVTASIGVAIAPGDADEPGRLLQCADIALYRAKEEGRNTFRFFEPEMDGRQQARRALERDLRTALVRGELGIHYQLQVEARDQEPVGVEALARWHHRQHGWVAPREFIAVAEETGLILPLSEWVLRTACAQVVAWPNVRLSVNLSPVQFRYGNLVALVRAALEESGLDPARLELETTEGVLHSDADGALAILRQLRELGVRIALDNFGSGYSSLGYLRKFPFDTIKIDRSFVATIENRSEADGILRAAITLGRSLGMRTCAEGVETAEQLAYLRAEGCDELQGYYFGHPVPAPEMARVLAAFVDATSLDA
jgi:diguanylate cyclase (GGDEF)-like protein/PAS domain S-box-containing protein